MPVPEGDDGIGEFERGLGVVLGRDDGERGLEVPLDRLLQLQRRIKQRQLDSDDWALLLALLEETTETTT